MLFSSPVYSQASGSIAGLVYAHGRAGMIVRARSTPTNPNTARQRIIRTAMATLSPYWGQTLNGAQRAGWDLYAANVPMSNALGATTFHTGQNHFMRTNIARIQASIAILDDAPSVYDLGTFTAPTILGVQESSQSVFISLTNTDDWANAVGGFMLIYQGRPVGRGRSFFDGPWRFIGSVAGNPVPPAGVQERDAAWPVFADNICWVYVRVIQEDGRMSGPIKLGPSTIV